MSAHHPIFRVFVSSSFRDFDDEREALRIGAFKALEQFSASLGVQFQAVDLRWGVNEDAALVQQTLRVCVEELRRYEELSPRLNFIVLLGERYGWRPLPATIEAAEFEALLSALSSDERTLIADASSGWYRRDENAVPPHYVLRPRVGKFVNTSEWESVERRIRGAFLTAIRELPLNDPRRHKYEDSATHHEIRHGALEVADAHEHVFCYFRTIEGQPADRERWHDLTPGGEIDWTAFERLQRLKSDLRERFGGVGHVYEYTILAEQHRPDAEALRQLSARVEADLKAVIQAQARKHASVRRSVAEVALHEATAHANQRVCVGREAELTKIFEYVSSQRESPLVLLGDTGSGLTTLLCRAFAQIKADESVAWRPIIRLVDVTPESSNGWSLIYSICRELAGTDADRWFADAAPTAIRHALDLQLARANAQQPIVIFIDGVQRLVGDGEDADQLSWLPMTLPPYVRIILTAGAVNDRCASLMDVPSEARIELPPLSVSDAGALLDLWFQKAGRALRANQRDTLLDDFARCPLPLYLRVAADEAIHTSPWDPVSSETETTDADVLLRMFERLAVPARHGPVLPRYTLGLLAASRRGLSENELLDLLSSSREVKDDFRRRAPSSPLTDRLPQIVWSQLRHDLGHIVGEREVDGSIVIEFTADLAKNQGRRWASTLMSDHRYHRQIAEYFASQPTTVQNRRKLWEMPFPMARAGMATELERHLTSLEFLSAKCAAGLVRDLIRDLESADTVPHASAEDDDLIGYVASLAQSRKDEPEVRKAGWLGWGRRLGERREMQTAKPPDSRPTIEAIRHADAGPAGTLENMGEDIRVAAVLSFLREHLHGVASHPAELIPIARNHARQKEIATAAERLSERLTRPWIARDPRDPYQGAGPLRVWHATAMRCEGLAATPDARRAVCTDGVGQLSVWNLRSGELVEKCVDGVAIGGPVAISADGSMAVDVGRSNAVRVWNLRRAQHVRSLEGATTAIRHLALSADGAKALALARSNLLSCWEVDTGRLLFTSPLLPPVPLSSRGRVRLQIYQSLLSPDSDHDTIPVRSMAIDATARLILCGDLTGAHCWKVHDTGVEFIWAIEDREHVCMTPDGTRAAVGRDDGNIRLVDVRTGQKLNGFREAANALSHPLIAMSLSADGRVVVTLVEKKGLTAWETESGAVIRRVPLAARTKALSVSADARRVTVVGNDGAVRTCDLTIPAAPFNDAALRGSIEGLQLDRTGQRVVSVSRGGMVEVFNLTNGSLVRTVKVDDPTRRPRNAIWSANGAVLTTALAEDIRTLDVETGDETVMTLDHDVMSVALASTAELLATTSTLQDRVFLSNAATGAPIRSFHVTNFQAEFVQITAAGDLVLTGSTDGAIRLWRSTGALVRELRSQDSYGRARFALSPNERILVTALNEVSVWIFPDWTLARTLPIVPGFIRALAFTADNRFLLCGYDSSVSVWNMASGQEVAVYSAGGAVSTVSDANSAGRFAVGTTDGEIHFLTFRNPP